MRRHLLALALLGSVGARLGEPEFSYSYTEGPSAAPEAERELRETVDTLTWGPAILGQDEPEGFQLGNSKSGFGAAFTYVLEDGTQRVFVSANSARMDGKACATGKHPVPPYTSCTRNR